MAFYALSEQNGDVLEPLRSGTRNNTEGSPATTNPVPARRLSTVAPFCKCTIFKGEYKVVHYNSLETVNYKLDVVELVV